MKHVLFVCTGNTCRSPMAEALCREKAKDLMEIKSAGVFAAPGMPASDGTIEVLKERNIKMQHESSPLTKELVDWADIILTMTKNHHELVVQTYPGAADKIYTIKEFTAEKDEDTGDILDPIGGTTDTYRKTAEELERLMDTVIEKVKNM